MNRFKKGMRTQQHLISCYTNPRRALENRLEKNCDSQCLERSSSSSSSTLTRLATVKPAQVDLGFPLSWASDHNLPLFFFFCCLYSLVFASFSFFQ
ncbi:hypothetical protein CEXT_690981 [Caerostris extrusa]|uniref:Uncharacterized protein n=1 Tax=Caerostris extrusa TaxID=172846 RepID=A0AAV4MCR6_CAEEX|nr:hypothetical protein CEXT_690981 [Caerostris extrusa]